MEKEDEIVSEYLIPMNAVLTRLTQQQTPQQSQSTQQSQSQSLEKLTMDEQYLSPTFPGAAPDPYEHCMISEFLYSFYSCEVFGDDTTCVCCVLRAQFISFVLFLFFFMSPQIYSIYHSIIVPMLHSLHQDIINLLFAINVWPDLNYISQRALQYQHQQQDGSNIILTT